MCVLPFFLWIFTLPITLILLTYHCLFQIQRLATTLGCTPARVLLSWAVQRGTSVVPKSATVERIVENLKVFRLSQEDFDLVDGLKTHETQVRYLDPRDYIGFDIFDEEKDQPVE